MHFHIKGDALRSLFEECVREFHNLCPGLARTLNKHTEEQSKFLRKQNGMSGDGHLKIHACIPQFLYAFISDQAEQRLGIDDVWRDPANHRLFVRIWTRAKVRTRPTPFYETRERCEKSAPTSRSASA